MRTGDFQNRWSSPKQLLHEYMSGYNNQRRDSAIQLQPARANKVAARGVAETEETGQKRTVPEPLRKENATCLTDQTRIINAFKDGLSSLKSDVTRLISTNKDFTVAHNFLTTGCETQKEVRRPEGYETPKGGYQASQNSTVLKRPAEPTDQVLHNQITMHKIPLGRTDIQSQFGRQDNRILTARDKKCAEQRDDLSRKFQDRQSDQGKVFNAGNQTDRAKHNYVGREQPEKHLEMVIEGMRRQNTELQTYYKQRLEESENERKNIDLIVSSKDKELSSLRIEIMQLTKLLRQFEERNLPRLVDSLQDKNQKLEQENQQLQSRLGVSQRRCTQEQEKVNRLEQLKRSAQRQNAAMLEELSKLKEAARKSAQEIPLLKSRMEQLRQQKDREIEQLLQQRESLATAKEEHDTKVRAETQRSRIASKSEMSKSSIIQLNSTTTSQSNLLEQAKKQEIDKLSTRIDELKRQKRVLEQDVKTLLETKEAIEVSIKSIPPSRTVQQLKSELSQKEQALASMRSTAQCLQQEKATNERLVQRLKINEVLLRQSNEALIKRELQFLNRNYK